VLVAAFGPAGEVIPVTLEPASLSGSRQYNLLEFAPKEWWKGSKSLMTAIDSGLIEVDAVATTSSAVPSSPATGAVPGVITAASDKIVATTGWTTIGALVANLSDYDAATLAVAASVNDTDLSLQVQLFNLTQRAVISTLTISTISPDITLTELRPIPSGMCVYEVKARLLSTPDPDLNAGHVLFAGIHTLKKVS
jgi:hypothetical protein